MTANIVNQVPFLRTSRNFPEDQKMLTVEVNKSYVDIANAVNKRTIGTFPTNRPAINGESWFLTSNQRQQAFRQAFAFTTTTSINHGIVISQIDRMVRNWGEFTDGTNWYGLIHATTVVIPGQITFYVTPTQIVFVIGAGAPSLTRGTVVLEWISDP